MSVPSPPGSHNSSISERGSHNRPPLPHNQNNMSASSNNQYMPHPQQNNPNPMAYNHGGTTDPGHTAISSISSNSGSANVVHNNQDRQLPITSTPSIPPQMALTSLPEIPVISDDLMGDGMHGLLLTNKDTELKKKEEKSQRRRKPARPLASDSEEEEDDDDEDNDDDDEEDDEPIEKKKEISASIKTSPPATQTNPPTANISDLLPPMGELISSDISLSFLNTDPHASESVVTNTKPNTSSDTPKSSEETTEAPLSAAAKRRNRRLAAAQAPLPSDSEEEEDNDDDDDDDDKPNLPIATTTINTTGNNPILGTSNTNVSTPSLSMNEAMDVVTRPRTGSVPLLNEGRRPSMPFDWQSNNSGN
jgi:hypothetical protein